MDGAGQGEDLKAPTWSFILCLIMSSSFKVVSSVIAGAGEQVRKIKQTKYYQTILNAVSWLLHPLSTQTQRAGTLFLPNDCG